MLKKILFKTMPMMLRKICMFNICMVPPRLLMVDSTPGAEIWAMKMNVGKAVTTFSKVSVKICEKQ